MQFFDTVNDGLVQTLDRLCSSTIMTYTLKNKATDLSDALDWYCATAFKADGQWSFDDITKTSPPIDTQDLFSGTNRYKFNSFTEKIINLIRLEVLDSTGKGVPLIPEDWNTLGVPVRGNASGVISGYSGQTFQEAYLNAPSGIPTHYMKFGDFVYLRPKPNYNYTAGLKVYFNRPATKFNFVTFTVTIATPGVFTSTAHGLSAGDTVMLETDDTLPTGLTVDNQYYVISTGLTADTFRLATTSGGSAINTSGSQSGTHCFLKTSASPGINPMHHIKICRKAAQISPNNFSNPDEKSKNNLLVTQDEMDIKEYFSRRTKDMPKRMMPAHQNNR